MDLSKWEVVRMASTAGSKGGVIKTKTRSNLSGQVS